jgi:hypothetical protein
MYCCTWLRPDIRPRAFGMSEYTGSPTRSTARKGLFAALDHAPVAEDACGTAAALRAREVAVIVYNPSTRWAHDTTQL